MQHKIQNQQKIVPDHRGHTVYSFGKRQEDHKEGNTVRSCMIQCSASMYNLRGRPRFFLRVKERHFKYQVIAVKFYA